MITQSDIMAARPSYEVVAKLEDQVNSHVNEIVREIFGEIFDWWDWNEDSQVFNQSAFPWDQVFASAGNSRLGIDLYVALYERNKDLINFVCPVSGTHYDLTKSIPARWLFMCVDDVFREYENHLKNLNNKGAIQP